MSASPTESTASQVVSRESGELLQTPGGQPSRVGTWAIDFANATHNLDVGATAADLGPSVNQGVTNLQTLANAIAEGTLHAGEGYKGQKSTQRPGSAYVGSANIAEQIAALGIPRESQAVLGMAANATAELSEKLDRGIYGNLTVGQQPDAFDNLAMEFGGMIAAVGSPQTQTGRYLWNEILRERLNPTPKRLPNSNPDFQQAPLESEQPEIRSDAQFIAKVAGALRLLEQRVGQLWPGQIQQIVWIKRDFLNALGLQQVSIGLLEDPKALAAFKSQLIQTSYLDELRKGPPEATATEASALPEQVQPASPDRRLMGNIASVIKSLAERGITVDTSIDQLKAQLASAEQQRAGITEAQGRLNLHRERLTKASSQTEDTARLRGLVGEAPETAQAGVEVLQLEPGSTDAILTNRVGPSLMGILVDPTALTKTMVDLYGVPTDKQAELAEATAAVTSIVNGAEILPHNVKVHLASPLKEALARVRSVVGEEIVTQKAAEFDRLLNPDPSLIVTDADRQTIQKDVQSAESLLATGVI